MVKLTLKGCKHPDLLGWDQDVEDGQEVVHATCRYCYERLLAPLSAVRSPRRPPRSKREVDNSELPPDRPAPLCPHTSKEPIPTNLNLDYTDALCMQCGVVLRHPEGPGAWEEVLFNGYVIREEP